MHKHTGILRSAIVWLALLGSVLVDKADSFLVSEKGAQSVLAMSYIAIGIIFAYAVAGIVLV